jgi:6-phosphogluconolactonase
MTELIFVGTYTEPKPHAPDAGGAGVEVLALDPSTGALERLWTQPGIADPSFVVPARDGAVLYAVSERDGPGEVAAYAVDRASGRLTEIAREPSGARGPCFAALDATGACLMVAHYEGGTVSLLPVREDGGLGAPEGRVVYDGGSHPHATVALGDSVLLVPDTGLDRLALHSFDPARATLSQEFDAVAFPAGSGPRHAALHPDGSRLYVCAEHASTLTVLAVEDGGVTELATASTLPPGFNGPNDTADVHVHPSGRVVYVSNRGHDSIAIFDVTGDLPQPLGHVSTQGRTPRSFALTADGALLLVANQDSDSIVAFAIDRETGTLEPTGHVTRVRTPARVVVSPR